MSQSPISKIILINPFTRADCLNLHHRATKELFKSPEPLWPTQFKSSPGRAVCRQFSSVLVTCFSFSTLVRYSLKVGTQLLD